MNLLLGRMQMAGNDFRPRMNMQIESLDKRDAGEKYRRNLTILSRIVDCLVNLIITIKICFKSH